MHIYGAQLKNLTLPLAPPAEQTVIADFLDNVLVKFDQSIARTHSEIDLMGEYRNRLIADVVTGKLDVREAAAGLPEVDPLAVDDEADDPFDAGDTPAFDEDQEVAEVVG